MNKRFLGLLITLGAVVILMAADMTITSYWPDDGDSDRKLLAKQAAALYELTESLLGYGTNKMQVDASFSGSVSTETNVNISSIGVNLPIYTADGSNLVVSLADTNIGATIVGGTLATETNINISSVGVNLPVYTPDGTNLTVTLSDTNLGVTIIGGTVDTNINISSVGVNLPIYTPADTNLSVIIAGGTNYIEALSAFPVYTPDGTNLTVTLSDTNIGATVLNTVTVTLSDTNVGATIVGTPTVTLSDTNVGATILNTVTTTLSDTNVGATILNTASVVGLTTIATVTPYITNAAYSDGDVMSHYAVLDVARVAGKAVQLQSVTVIDADDEGMAFEIMLFEAAPTLALPGEAWAVTDADMLNCVTFVSVGTSDYTDLGGNRIANVANINKSITPDSGTSIFMALRARGTSTYTATNDVTLKLVFYQD